MRSRLYIIIIIYPLTVKVVGALQMVLHSLSLIPVFKFLRCSDWLKLLDNWQPSTLYRQVITGSTVLALYRKSGNASFIYVFIFDVHTLELQRRIQAMEMRCYHKMLCISYKDHVTNKEVCAKIQQAIGPHKDLLTIVKRRKLQ